MMTHPDSALSFWHYLGTFALYTLAAVAAIYGMFVVLRGNPELLNRISTGRWLLPKAKNARQPMLSIESSLSLEPRKTVYMLRCGEERFLVASTGETMQFLSRLQPESDAAADANPETSVLASLTEAPVATTAPSQAAAAAPATPAPLSLDGMARSLFDTITGSGRQQSSLT